jgi:hypothetical protein
VYAVVRGVNGGGLISVPSRSLPVLLPPPLGSFRYVSDFDENGVMYYLGTAGALLLLGRCHILLVELLRTLKPAVL